MNANPLLNSVVTALAAAGLEAVLIGNAAAAIQGAPVTTVDFDFMFRATPVNMTKLKRFARLLEAVILRPNYPASSLFRVMNDERGLQADFMPVIHGMKSFNSLRSRADKIVLGGHPLWVLSALETHGFTFVGNFVGNFVAPCMDSCMELISVFSTKFTTKFPTKGGSMAQYAKHMPPIVGRSSGGHHRQQTRGRAAAGQGGAGCAGENVA